jgi:hypothetical protein
VGSGRARCVGGIQRRNLSFGAQDVVARFLVSGRARRSEKGAAEQRSDK